MRRASDSMSPPPIKERDPYFDNVRAILITLVVVGHLLQAVGGPLASPLVAWIYAFHMPAFVLVSGHLARNFSGTPDQLRRLVTGILVPFMIFQLIHSLLHWAANDKGFVFKVVYPAWTLWFLLALIIWRLISPIFRMIRFPLLVAVLVSLIAPLDRELGNAWSMGRVLGMLPFYVLGMLLEPKHFAFLRSRIPAWLGFAGLAAALGAAYLLPALPKVSRFYLNNNYGGSSNDVTYAMLLRFIILILGVGGTLAVLVLTGTRRTWFTRLGRYSLYVYLLHALVLFPVRYLDALGNWTSPAQTLALIAAGLLLSIVLASPPVIALTRWAIEPPWAERLLKPSTPPAISDPR